MLQNALIELMAEKDYNSITVREILDLADVGRSTFYSHFEYKDQLLYSCLEPLGELFEQHKQQVQKADNISLQKDELDLILNLFRFAAENFKFFKALLGRRNSGVIDKHIYDYLFTQVYDPLATIMSAKKSETMRLEITAHYFVSAFLGIFAWWIDKNMPCSPEEVDAYFKELTLPGFKSLFENNDEVFISGSGKQNLNRLPKA